MKIFLACALLLQSTFVLGEIIESQTAGHLMNTEDSSNIAAGHEMGGVDRHGKIADSLLDIVYYPQWREGRFLFRPGVQSSSYQMPVRIFIDPDAFKQSATLELAAETQFRPSGKPTSHSNIVGTVPASKLLLFNNVPGVLAVESPSVSSIDDHLSPAPFAVKHQNPVSLEKAGVYRAWERWGKGEGVKVGIIDGGFITLPMLMEAGILPKDKVHLRNPLPEELAKQHPYGTSIHGAAVAEVIHEIAPEAELYLYPTLVIPEMWEKAVLMAIEDGVHIINSSLNSTLGVLDGIGVPNKYLDPAIDAGILYINSAGNYGASTYVAPFLDSDKNGWHNYSDTDEGNTIFLNKGEALTVSLLWDDFGSNTEIPNSDQDLDLYLFYVDPDTRQMVQVAKSSNDQQGESSVLSMPAERLQLPPEGAPYTGNYSIMIKAHRISADRAISMRLIAEAYDFNAAPPNIYKRLQYASRQMTMTKPADHPDVLTVAACGVDGNLHPYSGTGPTESGVMKPDITGYTGLLTSSMQDPFLGTSCAAPFVTGCAALLWQKYPKADDVKTQIQARSITPPNSGAKDHDPSSGWGIVSLDEPDPTLPMAKLITASRVVNINEEQPIGFNFVIVFTCENGRNDHIYTSLYFKKPDGNIIKANDEFMVYSNSSHDLRVSSYIVPNSSDLAAFESWMIIPNTILDFAGEDAIVEVRLEDEQNKVLDSVEIGTVKDLKHARQTAMN